MQTAVANHPATVFVVDDEEPMRNALRRTLAQGGLVVQTFASGPEFLDGYRPAPASCLLLDMKMPDMTGLELQAILNQRRVDLPVIFLTGTADVPAAVTAMKAGAADFLEKPFENEALVARVRQCIAVDIHRGRVMEKMQAKTLAELVRMELTRRTGPH